MTRFNRQHIQLLIGLIGLSMLGVLVIQWLWLRNAVNLKKEEFKHDVAMSLDKTIQHLEKKEAIEKLRSHRQGKFLFFREENLDDFDDMMPDTAFEYFIIKDLGKEGDQIELKIVEESKQDQSIESTIKRVDTKDLLKQLDKKPGNIDIGFSSSFGTPYFKELGQKQLDSLVRDRLMNKRAFVGDIVKSLMEVNVSENIEDRINPNYLDSILNLYLTEFGVNTAVKWGVFNTKNQLVLSKNDLVEEDFGRALHVARLFPNDIIQDKHYIKLYFPNQNFFVVEQLWWLLLMSFLFLIVIAYVMYHIFNLVFTQKKLSELKNDFINNMTHELKTPISTISLACEALFDDDVNKNEGMLKRYLKMIEDENSRLKSQVERVLQSAVWEKGEIDLSLSAVNINEIVKNISERFVIQLKEKQGKIELNLDESIEDIEADEMHIKNVIYNLIDNAKKYSYNKPVIKIVTKKAKNGITFEVIDNGIGISKEEQLKVFDKLYRVPTGNLHNVKGFGLGLSYVKTIVEKHKGKISLESEINKGSKFLIFIPYEYK